MTYNTRSPAVKRLMKEAQELSEATELYYAKPLDDNLFEWHFTIRGPEDTEYDGGIYHGRIILPPEYPMKPPNILLMTPSGRFEINRKICLSISGYHPETWRPSWSIRTALLAIIGFMPTHGVGAIGSLEYPVEERKKLAKSSQDFVCPQCGPIKDVLKTVTEASATISEEAKSLAEQISFTGEKPTDKLKDEIIEKEKINLGDVNPNLNQNITASLETTTGVSPVMLIPMSFEQWKTQKLKQDSNIQSTNTTPSQKDDQNSGGGDNIEEKDEKAKESNSDELKPTIEKKEEETKEIVALKKPQTITTQLSPTTPAVPPAIVTGCVATPTTTINNDFSSVQSSIVSLQQRQALLFKLIVVLFSILVVLLAVRLNILNNLAPPHEDLKGGPGD